MNLLSLFSGIGAFDYGLERVGMSCVGQCEVDPYCRAVLDKHWPGLPRWEDVREVTPEEVLDRAGPVDAVAGGFPCQPHSVAGRRRGQSDERHLWPEFARLIRGIRPRWVVAENVPGLRGTAADEVLGDLEAAGYACWPCVVGAWAVGAPHRRDRVWIVARRSGMGNADIPRTDTHAAARPPRKATGESGRTIELAHAERLGHQRCQPAAGPPSCLRRRLAESCGVNGTLAHPGGPGLEGGRPLPGGAGPQLAVPAGGGRDSELADADGAQRRPDGGRDADRAGPGRQTEGGALGGGGHFRWPARPGQPQYEWEAPRLAQFGVGGPTPRSAGGLVRASAANARRVVVGEDAEVDWLKAYANRSALKALGNAVVWQVPYLFGRWILEQESEAAR